MKRRNLRKGAEEATDILLPAETAPADTDFLMLRISIMARMIIMMKIIKSLTISTIMTLYLAVAVYRLAVEYVRPILVWPGHHGASRSLRNKDDYHDDNAIRS